MKLVRDAIATASAFVLSETNRAQTADRRGSWGGGAGRPKNDERPLRQTTESWKWTALSWKQAWTVQTPALRLHTTTDEPCTVTTKVCPVCRSPVCCRRLVCLARPLTDFL